MMRTKKRQSSERTLENYLYASDKLRMFALVTEMMNDAKRSFESAISALDRFDLDLAQKVIDGDDAIDILEEQIDQECLYSIAMRQPLREDLRYVYAVMKIITDIERIGDQAVNVALCLKSCAEEYGGHAPLLKVGEMKSIGAQCSEMADDFLAALKAEDPRVLYVIGGKHAEAGRQCDAVSAQLMDRLSSPYRAESPAEIFTTIDIFRHLKRVTDHLMNLGEKVYFIATGISPLTLKKKMNYGSVESSAVADRAAR